MRVPFGRYRGWLLTDLPDDYLEWLSTIAKQPLLAAVDAELMRRDAVRCLPDPEVHAAAETIVQLGFRAAALRVHPDHGGDDTAMRAVLAAREWLTELTAASA